MGDARTFLESTDSAFILAAQAVTAEALDFQDKLQDELAQKIIAKLGHALG